MLSICKFFLRSRHAASQGTNPATDDETAAGSSDPPPTSTGTAPPSATSKNDSQFTYTPNELKGKLPPHILQRIEEHPDMNVRTGRIPDSVMYAEALASGDESLIAYALNYTPRDNTLSYNVNSAKDCEYLTELLKGMTKSAAKTDYSKLNTSRRSHAILINLLEGVKDEDKKIGGLVRAIDEMRQTGTLGDLSLVVDPEVASWNSDYRNSIFLKPDTDLTPFEKNT